MRPPTTQLLHRSVLGCSIIAAIALVAAQSVDPDRVERAASAARAGGSTPVGHTARRQPKRWREQQTTVLLDGSLADVGPGAPALVRRAFAVWQSAGVELPDVHFEAISGVDPEGGPDGLNTVSVAPIELPGHQDDLAVTITYRNLQSGEVTEADIVVNARKPWTTSAATDDGCAGRFDLQSVLNHEVGHFLGLRDESDALHSTMYFVTSACETHKRSLDGSDIQTVTALYADGFEDPAVIQCAAVGAARRRPASGAGWLLLLACLGAWRRRHAPGARPAA